MGDELHSRNSAAALLFLRELVPSFLALAVSGSEQDRSCRQGHGRRPIFLPASVHGRRQGHRRRGARHRRLERRDRHGFQLPRIRRARERTWRHLVQGTPRVGGSQAVRWPQRRRDHLDGRRKHHRRDDRAWRLRPSLGPIAPGLPGRLIRDDDRPQQGTLRHHRRRESGLPRSGPWLSRHADRHRHFQGAREQGASGAGYRHRRKRRRPDRRRRGAAAACLLRGRGRGLPSALSLMPAISSARRG